MCETGPRESELARRKERESASGTCSTCYGRCQGQEDSCHQRLMATGNNAESAQPNRVLQTPQNTHQVCFGTKLGE